MTLHGDTGAGESQVARQTRRRLVVSSLVAVAVVLAAFLGAHAVALARGGDARTVFSTAEIVLFLSGLGLLLIAVLHIGLGSWIVAAARRLERLTAEVAERDAARSREAQQRQRAEARLAELLDFKQKIIAESTLGILAYRAAGPCVLANEAAALMVGESVEALLGQDFRHAFSRRAAGLLDAADAALRSGMPRHVDVQLPTSARGELSLNCDVVPFSSGGEPHLLLLASDVSGDRAAERALREARALAERANRAKTEFLANMSHEIRTPMNAVIGLTQLVLDTDLSTRQRDYLRKIESASKALLGVLNAILDYAKIEAGALEVESRPFSPRRVIGIVHDLFAVKAEEKGLELTVRIAPGLPEACVGDPLRFGQIVSSLLSNALKFTERGSVVVDVSLIGQAEDRVGLLVAVTDTGIGVSSEHRERLFEAFSQADSSITRRFGGSGLGLAVSKRLVELMGGEIGFESQPGHGSRFHFTVPLRVADGQARPLEAGLAEAPADASSFAGTRVLLVEDNEVNLMVAKMFLENAGVIVHVARNGREAVDRASAEPFDAILMDVQMPVMDGLEATRTIRREEWGKTIAIIAMTAGGTDEDRRACLDAGMSDYLAKPITPSQVLGVLARMLRRPVPATPAPEPGEPSASWALPGFDLAGAQARMGTDAARLAAVLWRFARDFAGTPEDLERLLALGDLEGAARVAHRVKGTAATVGAVALQAAAASFEQELKAGALNASFPTFLQALREAIDVVTSQVPPPGGGRTPAALDPAALSAALDRLSLILSEHELVPDTLLAEVCDRLAGPEVDRLAESLRNEVESFDYARARETVQAIARALGSNGDAHV